MGGTVVVETGGVVVVGSVAKVVVGTVVVVVGKVVVVVVVVVLVVLVGKVVVVVVVVGEVVVLVGKVVVVAPTVVVVVGNVVVVAPTVVVVVGSVVVVAPTVVVVVVTALQVDVVKMSSFNVTAPFRASARPSTVVPLANEIELSAKIFPTNWLPVPIVAELPTCHQTFHACTPPFRNMRLPDAVVNPLTAWKIKTEFAVPVKVRVPVSDIVELAA